MILPSAFSVEYERLRPDLEAVEEHSKGALTKTLADLKTSLQTRVKSDESAYLKMLRHGQGRLLDLHDLVAVRVVALNLDVRTAAIAAVKGALPIVDDFGLQRERKPSDLAYQEPHLIARSADAWLDRHPEWAGIAIEIQFTTNVQCALNESLHDITYKNSRFSWRASRVDAELRGELEVVDVMLASFEKTTAAMPEQEYEPFSRRNRLMDSLERHIPKEQLPEDRRRLCEVVLEICDVANVRPEDLDALLGLDSSRPLLNSTALTPPERVLGAFAAALGGDFCQAYCAERKAVLSRELSTLFPRIAGLFPPDRVVSV